MVDGGDLVDPIAEAALLPMELTEEEKKKLREKEKNEENFAKFQHWIDQNAPRVAKLQYPFTQPEFERLKKEFTIDQIQDIIQKMHNYRPLFTKSISANLTFRSWIRKDYNNEPTTNTRTITTAGNAQAKPKQCSEYEQHVAARLASRQN